MHAVQNYLWHWLTAVNEHSLHSPFIYNFYTKTIKRKAILEDFAVIEEARKELIRSNEKIEIAQLGADSKVNNNLIRPVSAIASKGMASVKTSKLLYNIIRNYGCKNVIELGTSFGINAMYMAANTTVNVVTFEGDQSTAQIARKNFDSLGYTNISLVEGNIDTTLPQYKSNSQDKIDLALIDANHRLEPTLTYFNHLLPLCSEQSFIIIDDIYWSKEMTKAWKTLQNHPRVAVSIDLYQLGILVLRPELGKEHYRLMF